MFLEREIERETERDEYKSNNMKENIIIMNLNRRFFLLFFKVCLFNEMKQAMKEKRKEKEE